MNVIRTIPAPERRSLKRLSTQAATPTVRAQVLAVTDEGVDKNAEEIAKIKSDKPNPIQTSLIDNLF